MSKFCIGWDVGGWDCDRNPRSRDALVIMDKEARLVGQPWRGNLRHVSRQASSVDSWIHALFKLCGAACPKLSEVTMAIDAPLAFPRALTDLCIGTAIEDSGWPSADNPYLFRATERYLAKKGWRPLSPVKDMLGSQTAKVMHLLRSFGFEPLASGIWQHADGSCAFETYPTASRHSQALEPILRDSSKLSNQDMEDARVCAAVAWLMSFAPDQLEHPPTAAESGEGWIWIPRSVE
jgi:predicted nuclease with RNAse H fold